MEDIAALLPHYYNCKGNSLFKVAEFEKIEAINGHGDPHDLKGMGKWFYNVSSGEEPEER